MDYNPNIHGPVDYGKDSKGNQSFDSGMGFGIGSDGGPVSNKLVKEGQDIPKVVLLQCSWRKDNGFKRVR